MCVKLMGLDECNEIYGEGLEFMDEFERLWMVWRNFGRGLV